VHHDVLTITARAPGRDPSSHHAGRRSARPGPGRWPGVTSVPAPGATRVTRIGHLDPALALRLHALDRAEAAVSGRGLVLTTPQALARQLTGAVVWVAGPVAEPVGWASLEGGLLTGTVHPRHRRRGLGTALLGAALARAGATAPRMRLTSVVWRDSGGEAFLRGHGFTPTGSAALVVRHLDLAGTRERRRRLVEDTEQHAVAYRFVRVAGELGGESGATSYVVRARHRETGAEAGRAELIVADDVPGTAVQGDLVVVETHRGHRLGLRMELELLHWLDADPPGVRALQLSHGPEDLQAIVIADRLGRRVAGVTVELAR
jgi:GNAT superfamily N-acetyltransferase